VSVLGDRRACVARELTKLHEEVVHGSLRELAEHFGDSVKGEVTLVVEGAPQEVRVGSVAELDPEIHAGLKKGESSKQLSVRLAEESGLPRRVVYGRILALRDRREAGRI
jgi:16S rRNA (cytidine1402-2'-O)-methyltransferase